MFSAFLEKIQNESAIDITPLRKDIIRILYNANKPMGAYEILTSLMKKRPNAKPPTVYRVLDFLKSTNVIHKIDANNTYTCCQASHACSNNIILTCHNCRNTLEVNAKMTVAELQSLAQKNGFNMANSPIEITGLCASCQA